MNGVLRLCDRVDGCISECAIPFTRSPRVAVQLTCPTCRSGLQVPDGTTAHVRCPACRTVFAPDDNIAPAPLPLPLPPPPPPPRPAPRPVRKPAPLPLPPPRVEKEDRPPPRRRRRGRGRDEYAEEDDQWHDKERARRRALDDGLTPEERRAQRAAFQRGAWGCRLVALSLSLYATSMFLICMFFIRAAAMGNVDPGLLNGAGVLGLINWTVSAVGVGLCMSGRPSPGHWRYAIVAAVMVVVHGIFLLAVVNRGEAAAEFLRDGNTVTVYAGTLAQLPTKMDTLTLYMTWMVYPDRMYAPNRAFALSLITGAMEMLRLASVMLLLACLARAAGDDELAYRCARAAGRSCFIPGVMALGVLLIAAFIFETNAQSSSFGAVVAHLLVMGVYALLAGMILPPLLAARECVDACEYPFESQRVVIGG